MTGAIIGRTRGHAVFDASRTYRYLLRRAWAGGPRVAFVMLNPSAADATRDDPTIRRCLGFARRWRCGAMDVVNLFAYRTHDQRELARAGDPVGPENERHLRAAVAAADLVVCAWGASRLARARARHVRPLLEGRPLRCLGRTKIGAPRHPLYLGRAERLRGFSGW